MTFKLEPGYVFPEPRSPLAEGEDAPLFRRYARLQRLYGRRMALDAVPFAEQDEAAIERVELMLDRAEDLFRRTPARTLEGVLLKFDYAIAGDFVDDDGQPAGGVDHALIVAAMEDLRGVAASRPPGAQRGVACRQNPFLLIAPRRARELRAAA